MPSFHRRLSLSPLVAVAAAAGLYGSVAGAQPAKPSGEQCFSAKDWRGWKASPDSRAIYIRVGVSRVFRLDLSGACPHLQDIGARLDTREGGGSSFICSPQDLDLRVSTPPGVSISCIVSGITALTPEQTAALPGKLRP